MKWGRFEGMGASVKKWGSKSFEGRVRLPKSEITTMGAVVWRFYGSNQRTRCIRFRLGGTFLRDQMWGVAKGGKGQNLTDGIREGQS